MSIHELRELRVVLEQGYVVPSYDHECWMSGEHLPKNQRCYSVRYVDRLYGKVRRIWISSSLAHMFTLGQEDLAPHEQEIMHAERFASEVFHHGVSL